MFSEMIREALGQEVVGQPDAVNGVARGLTRLVSGLTPAERSWCTCLFVGPAGTGRAHLVRSVARLLYGQERLLTVNCKVAGPADPWGEFVRQLEPLAAMPQGPVPPAEPRPFYSPSFEPSRKPLAFADGHGPLPKLVLVQHLECGRKELFPQLAYLLESGQVMLPSGRTVRLDGCMLFFTTSLCTDQILDQSRLGFSQTTREATSEERDSLHKIVREEAGKVLGLDLLAQFDNLVVFRELSDDHLGEVLVRRFNRMDRWLHHRGMSCKLEPAAHDYLLSTATAERTPGAHDLVRIHRREVEFPLADLLVSGALEPGSTVVLDHREGEEHLHFSVHGADPESSPSAIGAREIPVGA